MPDPAPLTSIAWLSWHIGSVPGRLSEIDVFGGEHAMASGWTSPYLSHHPIFTTAAEATAALRDGWARLRATIATASDELLATATPRYTYASEPMRGGLCVLGPPGPEVPVSALVAGGLNEVSHHGSQICVLRDLFAARS